MGKATYRRPPALKAPKVGTKFTASAGQSNVCTAQRTAKSGANGALPPAARRHK